MELRKKTRNISLQLDEKFMEFCDDFNPEYEGESEFEVQALEECLEALPEIQR